MATGSSYGFVSSPIDTARLLSRFLFCVPPDLFSVFVYTYFYVCDFDPALLGMSLHRTLFK